MTVKRKCGIFDSGKGLFDQYINDGPWSKFLDPTHNCTKYQFTETLCIFLQQTGGMNTSDKRFKNHSVLPVCPQSVTFNYF